MADEQTRKKRPTPKEIAKIAEQVFAQPVVRMTAPGGKGRESIRVHFADWNAIATWRPETARGLMEIAVLRGLSGAGAPVPEVLGEKDGVFFQTDLGSRRFSAELTRMQGADLDDLVARAFESIFSLQRAAVVSGILDKVPKLGISRKWIMAALSGPEAYSDENGIANPALDKEALASALTSTAPRFIKWDARPGNAALDPSGAVCWFDWEHCGRREGVEDFGWMAGDEFWPMDPVRTLSVLERTAGDRMDSAAFDHLAVFATFHTVQRLRLIRDRVGRRGWVDEADARRYDKIGSAPGLADRLCKHGAGWADILPATRALVPWFEVARHKLHAAATVQAAQAKG